MSSPIRDGFDHRFLTVNEEKKHAPRKSQATVRDPHTASNLSQTSSNFSQNSSVSPTTSYLLPSPSLPDPSPLCNSPSPATSHLSPFQQSLDAAHLPNTFNLRFSPSSITSLPSPPCSSSSSSSSNSTQIDDSIEEYCDAFLASCKKWNWSIPDPEKESLKQIVFPNGRPLLHEALFFLRKKTAMFLLVNRLSVQAVDPEGNSPIHFVAMRGHSHFLDLILRHNKINKLNNYGQTPAHFAAENNSYETLSILANEGANLNQPTTEVQYKGHQLTRVSPIHVAVIHGSVESVNILLKNDKVMFQLDVPGYGNILHLAVFFDQENLLKRILKAHLKKVNSLLNAFNQEGLTPLMYAAYHEKPETLRILHSFGANFEANDPTGKTALHWAAIGRSRNAAELLAYLGCDLTVQDSQGETPQSIGKQIEGFGDLLSNLQTRFKKYELQPPLFELYPPINLVFQGGGPKGLAYVGALEVLEKQGHIPTVLRCAGTSAGAITAALVACGCSASDIHKLLKETTLNDFLDHNFTSNSIKKYLRDINISESLKIAKQSIKFCMLPCLAVYDAFKSLWNTPGFCEGEVFRLWMESQVFKMTKIRFCTFKELAEKSRRNPRKYKQLHVFATNQRTKKPTEFSAGNVDVSSVIISDAVRASMSIPGAFKPHTLHIKFKGERVEAPYLGEYVDGGLIYNFPLRTFDKRKYLPAFSGEGGEIPITNKQTLGFSLFTPKEVQKNPSNPPNIQTVKDLAKCIFSIYYNAEEFFIGLHNPLDQRTIKISDQGVGMLEFNLSKERQDDLIESGRKSSVAFFRKQERLSQKTSARTPPTHTASHSSQSSQTSRGELPEILERLKKIDANIPSDWETFEELKPAVLRLEDIYLRYPQELCSSLLALGVFERNKGNYKDSIAILTRVLKKQNSSQQDDERPNTLAELGLSFILDGKIQKGIQCLTQALFEYPRQHPKRIDCLNYLSRAHIRQGKLIEAKKRGKEASALCEQIFAERDNSLVAGNLYQLGTIAWKQDKFGNAHNYLIRALRMQKRLYESHGENHPDIAYTLHQLGNVAMGQRKKEGALTYYNRSLEMRKNLYRSRKHVSIATTLYRLANLHDGGSKKHAENGALIEAWSCYENSYEIRKALVGADDPATQLSKKESLACLAILRDRYSQGPREVKHRQT